MPDVLDNFISSTPNLPIEFQDGVGREQGSPRYEVLGIDGLVVAASIFSSTGIDDYFSPTPATFSVRAALSCPMSKTQ